MKYSDFIREVVHRSELSKDVVKEVIDSMVDVIPDLLCSGEDVSIPGLGCMKARMTKERVYRNPQTGEPMVSKPHLRPYMRFSQPIRKALKETGE